MRRWALLLVLGVVLNVGVAWAIWAVDSRLPMTTRAEPDEAWPGWVPKDWPAWAELKQRNPQRWSSEISACAWVFRVRSQVVSDQSTTPRGTYRAFRVEVGFPLRSLVVENADGFRRVINAPGLLGGLVEGSMRPIPVAPLPAGFVINTVAYAGLLWGATRLWGRRRRS